MKRLTSKTSIKISIVIALLTCALLVFNHYQYVTQIWSISIYEGESIQNLKPASYIKNPILQASDINDVDARFVADPFIIKDNGLWYLFFEIYDENRAKGEIGLATSSDLKKWKYEKVVLSEEFHLSYPYVFAWNNEYYMLPEKAESGCVSLYKASEFPYRWELVKNLLQGNYVDSSIFRYNNIWWILATEKGGDNLSNGNLHLFYSEDLFGEWTEHIKSPVVKNDSRIARPGGRVIVDGQDIIRFAQDNTESYGRKVCAFRINELSKEKYGEEELGIVIEESLEYNTWNADGMHNVDVIKLDNNEYIAIVDGEYNVKHNGIIDILNEKLLVK